MLFSVDSTEAEFVDWLAQSPGEDELRCAYISLETRRAALWTPGHIDSFRRNRYELDGVYVDRLVRLKWTLANRWLSSGQFDRLIAEPQLV